MQPETPDSANPNSLKLVSPSADSIYPWSSEFQVSLPETFTKLTGLYLCSWDASRLTLKDDKTDIRDCTLLEPLKMQKTEAEGASKTVPLVGRVSEQDIPIGADGLPKDPLYIVRADGSVTPKYRLLPDTNVQVCATRENPKDAQQKDDKKKDEPQKAEICTATPLRVQRPFFPRAWVTVRGEVNYAIFGALDPALTGLISPENSSFGDNDEYISQIKIPDPAPALEQLRVTFERLNPEPHPHWTYVLLAQMPRSTAQALSAALQWRQEHPPKGVPGHPSYHFDVMLSAADSAEATPDMDLTLDQDRRPTPIITPHPIVIESKMRNPLSLLQIDTADIHHAHYINHTDPDEDEQPVVAEHCTDADQDAQVVIAKHCFFQHACKSYKTINAALQCKSDDYLEQQLPLTQRKLCSANNSFQCLALEMMREQLDADVAFLQQNDFYNECNYEGPEGGNTAWAPIEMVGRVLWNSGYLTRVSVSGATLRTILQNSDKIKQQEQSSTSEPTVRKQDLVTLGVSKANGLYFVDGAAVDDNKIYAVAASDQLAFETGAYPQFGQLDLVAPSVYVGWDKHTYSVAQLATLPFIPPTQADALDRNKVVAHGPAESEPLKAPLGPKSIPLANASETELAVQNRNFLTLTLQQASIGYTNSKPSQTDANVNSNLAGVTNPNVASPHSDSLSYSDAFRLIYQRTAHWNVGFDQLISFSRSRQGSLTGTTQMTPSGQVVPSESINLSANSLIASPFVEFQLHRYQGKHWKLVARPITFSTQLSRTLQFLPTGTKGLGLVYELNLRRQENWQPSAGGRYEKDALNFFEAGYLNQTARNVLAGLDIDGTPHSLTAGVTAAEVAAMAMPKPNSGSVAIPIYGTFHQQGGYWLGMYTRALFGHAKNVKITYQGLTYGNFFAYGPVDLTSTALTRYAAELANSLQVQLWGNISIGPSYNVFWFQDQSHSAGDNLTRRDWNLQLNYQFDWHQGIEWKYALAGKTAQ
ncbi:MAG: hypothetical protein WA655_09200 [Candidatus Korobacteraceae bacterium]